MQSLNSAQLTDLKGGLSAVATIGSIACGVTMFGGPIGWAIAGPTCGGMLLATALGY